MADHKPTLPARVHPDDRDRIEGLNTLARLYYGTPQSEAPVSYYTPILIQCTLPHSDPKTRDWKKTNEDFTLIISSGVDKSCVGQFAIAPVENPTASANGQAVTSIGIRLTAHQLFRRNLAPLTCPPLRQFTSQNGYSAHTLS